MFTTTVCTIIACDVCKDPIPDVSGDYEGSPHFDNETEALAALSWDPDDLEQHDPTGKRGWLAGFQLTATTLPGMPAGAIVCFGCLVPRLCAVRGHRWDDWALCRCATSFDGPCTPRILEHRINGCPENRHCERCHAREERPAAVIEVTV